jgi:hypothetical protein
MRASAFGVALVAAGVAGMIIVGAYRQPYSRRAKVVLADDRDRFAAPWRRVLVDPRLMNAKAKTPSRHRAGSATKASA